MESFKMIISKQLTQKYQVQKVFKMWGKSYKFGNLSFSGKSPEAVFFNAAGEELERIPIDTMNRFFMIYYFRNDQY